MEIETYEDFIYEPLVINALAPSCGTRENILKTFLFWVTLFVHFSIMRFLIKTKSVFGYFAPFCVWLLFNIRVISQNI